MSRLCNCELSWSLLRRHGRLSCPWCWLYIELVYLSADSRHAGIEHLIATRRGVESMTVDCKISLKCYHYTSVCVTLCYRTFWWSLKHMTALRPFSCANNDNSAVILGRCVLHPGLVCRQQVAAAVGRQRGTRRAAHKDHDRSEGLCRGWPGHLEQPPRQPVDFITVRDTFAKKLKTHLFGCERSWGLL